jgi:hypothetical protein
MDVKKSAGGPPFREAVPACWAAHLGRPSGQLGLVWLLWVVSWSR